MPDYPVRSELRHSGQSYSPGAVITLSEGEAKNLVELGVLGQPVAAQPVKSAEKKDEPPSLKSQPSLSQPASPDPTPSEPAKVNLNTATKAVLEALDAIGPATTKKLMAGRPYKSLEAAQAASGMPAEVWAQIADRVSVED